MSTKEPAFNIREPSILYVIVILAAIHLVKAFFGLTDQMFDNFALFPLDSVGLVAEPSRQAYSLLTHGFLHLDFNHLLMNSGSILIFGLITFQGVRAKMGFGSKGLVCFWVLFWAGVAAGGLAQWTEWSFMNVDYGSAVGASGGASALFASAGWAMGGRDGLVKFTGAFIVLNILLVWMEPSISWSAHAGGYIAGAMLAYYWVKPSSAKPSMRR